MQNDPEIYSKYLLASLQMEQNQYSQAMQTINDINNDGLDPEMQQEKADYLNLTIIMHNLATNTTYKLETGNPANDYVMIEYELMENGLLVLNSIDGKMVFTSELPAGKDQRIVPTQELSPGTYRTFSYPYRDSWAYSVTETYDKGYLILSNFLKNGDNLHTGWLIKTDVNGNKLWERYIGNYDGYQSVYEKIAETSDKGVIIPGSWDKGPYSNSPDPLFLKLNACGNLEWCRYFKTDNHMDFGVDMIEVTDGFVGLMKYYGNDYITQRKFYYLKSY